MGAYCRLALAGVLLLALGQGARLTFYLANRSQMGGEATADLLWAFVEGFRFDLATLIVLNAPFLLLALLVPFARFPSRILGHRAARAAFVAINGVALSLSLADAAYYPFVGRRLTVDSFAIAQDIRQQAGQLLAYYWHLGLLGLTLFAVAWWVYPLIHGRREESTRLWSKLVKATVALAVIIIGARGGLQAKPLTPAHAYQNRSHALAQLTLNSAFSVIKSLGRSPLSPVSFYSSWDEVHAALGTDESREETSATPWRPNVVLIILESFHLEYVLGVDGKVGHAPFFLSLAREGRFYERHFANGRRSIDAMPSLLGGLPALMEEAWITSPYQGVRLPGLPQAFREAGYDTAFFHGGHDGTMFFDVMAQRFGFARYFGAKSFPDQTKDDGRWGIWDEPFLQFASAEMGKLGKPFFATIFTLTSHHPYKIPEEMEERFAPGPLPIHRAVRYADFALQRFFETASKESWFENTLFVLTADHAAEAESETFSKFVGKYRVPLVFWHPKGLDALPVPLAHESQVTQHVDVPETLIDLLDLPSKERARFGHSLARSDHPSEALFYGENAHVLVRRDVAVKLRGNGEATVHFWENDPGLKEPLEDLDVEDTKRRLKAYVQYFGNGLIENRTAQ